jgi:hypothetical protein
MKLLTLFLFLPFLAFSQNCPDDFWKQAVLAGQTTVEIQLVKGQAYKPVIIERADTNIVETWVLTKKVVSAPVIVEQIVDGELATFSSNWTYHGSTIATGWHANTISFSNVAGSTVTYSFTGRKIEVYGETLPGHGTGTIKIDNEPEVTVSFKSATKVLPAKIFEKSWATDGPHTITVKVTTGYVLADYFKVYRAQ